MALKIAPTTHRTCSGVFLRMDEGFGLLAHSPYTGLTYAIGPSDADRVSQWLNNNSSEPPADHYKYSLEAMHRKRVSSLSGTASASLSGRNIAGSR